MFGIRYLKAPPTSHILHFRRGRVVREGAGLSFFYYAPSSTIVRVPVGTMDVPFVFQEVTADFQDVTIQGELTYRVADPQKIARLLDFSIDQSGMHRSDDPAKLNERLIHAAQVLARTFTQTRRLGDVLVSSQQLLDTVRQGLGESDVVQMLGVEVVGASLLAIKPTAEMAKALQSEAREQLLKQADQAIYDRRNTAVELERRIKENELNTEIAVQEKQRQVRQTQMEADIAVESKRAELVDQRVSNERKEAQARVEALRAILESIKDVDWRTLLAMSQGGGLDARQLIAMAFRDLADNAGKIGTLNITPELLESLLGDKLSDATPGSGGGGAERPRRK